MNCPKCGTLNSSESKFCIKCGQSLSMEPQQFPETTTQVIPNQSVNNTQIQDGSTFQNININTNLQPVNDVTNNSNEFNISNNSNNISSGNLNLDNNNINSNITNNLNNNNNVANDLNNNNDINNNDIINFNHNINLNNDEQSIGNNVNNDNINTTNNTNEINYNNNLNNTNINTEYNIGETNLNNNLNSTTTEEEKNKSLKNKLLNKKTILIALVIVVVVALAFILIKNIGGNSSPKADLDSIFNPDKPIIINDNKKYGYITAAGKMMIEPQYRDANDFYGDYAMVTIDNPDTKSYDKTINQIIDKKGNVKIVAKNYTKPKYFDVYNVWLIDNVLYDSKLKKLSAEGAKVEYIDCGYFKYENSEKNESGIITYKGKKVFKTAASSISTSLSENEYNQDDLYVAVDIHNKPEKSVVVSLKTGDILFTLENSENYYLLEEGDGIFSYYDTKVSRGYENSVYLYFTNNKLAYQTTDKVEDVKISDYKNKIIEIDYGYDYEDLGKSQRRYYYDAKNKKMLDKDPDNSASSELNAALMENTYGFKMFSSSGKYGLMIGNKIVIPCEYTEIKLLGDNLFNYMQSKGKNLVLLEKDNKTILYNVKNSKSIITFDSNNVRDYNDSTFIEVILYANGSSTRTGYMVYNLLTGKSMTFDKDNEVFVESNYIEVKKDKKTTYYNTKFKQIYVTEES